MQLLSSVLVVHVYMSKICVSGCPCLHNIDLNRLVSDVLRASSGSGATRRTQRGANPKSVVIDSRRHWERKSGGVAEARAIVLGMAQELQDRMSGDGDEASPQSSTTLSHAVLGFHFPQWSQRRDRSVAAQVTERQG